MTNTQERPRRDRGEGMIYRKPGSAIWTARLYVAVLGRHRKRSTKTTDEQKARRFLAKWRAEVIGGTWLPDADKTTFDQLAQMLLDDYRANGRRSLNRVEGSLAHLRPAFGHLRVRAISRDRIVAYARQRRAEDEAAPATINRELACLKRMFTLGRQAGKVALIPHIPMLEEHNVRTGFFERDQFDAVLHHLADDLRPPIHAAYLTGWRLQSELLTRQWRHVDFVNGWLRLDPRRDQERGGPDVPSDPGAAGRPRGPARPHPRARAAAGPRDPVGVPPRWRSDPLPAAPVARRVSCGRGAWPPDP
jgi:hypothetical protein